MFKINYETRDTCVEFLQKIAVNEDDKTVAVNKDNIDFYHISMAYQSIRDWERDYSASHDGKELDSAGFQSAFLARTKVIWYEISGREEHEESEKLFERLNLGKIPLTNAELTKALFLASELCGERSGQVLGIAGGRVFAYRLVETLGKHKDEGAAWTAEEIAEHWEAIAK